MLFQYPVVNIIFKAIYNNLGLFVDLDPVGLENFVIILFKHYILNLSKF